MRKGFSFHDRDICEELLAVSPKHYALRWRIIDLVCATWLFSSKFIISLLGGRLETKAWELVVAC